MCAFALFSPVVSFSHGAPDFSCKDPSTFHTRKINATHEGIIMPGDILINPYSLMLEGSTYRPGEKITGNLLEILYFITNVSAQVKEDSIL